MDASASTAIGPLRRICVVMMSAVGNAVHVLPVLNAIKRAHPDAHITWVMQPGVATLVRGHPAVDEIIHFDRARGWRAYLDLRRAFASRPFDVVLDFQVYFKAGVVTALARAPVKLGFDRARARDLNWLFTNRKLPPHAPSHTQDQYLEFLAALGVPDESLEWKLGPWPDEREWQREFFRPIERPAVALVIGSTKAETSWVASRWAQLADALHQDFGLQTILVGGRSESELQTRATIMSLARHHPIDALGSGLRRLVSILDGSALVVSLDTGPLHMSVALDRPVVSLMGYNNPKRTGPYRRFHDLIVDAYGDPSEEYPISFEHRPGRMPRIQVADVLAKVGVWRERYGRGVSV